MQALNLKRSPLTVLALSGLLFCAVSVCSASNWYVRPGGAGSKNGSDWNNAWDSGSIGWSSVAAGDTVWIAGGNYSGTINFTKSGASGNPISLKRATASDAAATSAAGWNSSFDSQVVINNQTGLNWTSSAGSYVNVDGRTTSGIKLNVPDNTSYNAGVGVNGPHDVVINCVEIAGPGSSTTFSGDVYLFGSGKSANITLSNSSIHGSPNLIALGQSANGIVFDHVKFYDNGAANASAHHPNLCYAADVQNVVFRYCDFTSWDVEGIYLLGNCGAFYIYGNTFHDASGVARVLSLDQYGNTSGSQGPVYVYNNTFENVTGVGVYCKAGSPVPYAAGSQARNNIYWNCFLGDDTPGSFDYEFSSGSIPGANSISSGSNPFVNLNGGDYHIVSTVGPKYPKNEGVALAAPYNYDMDGNLRGADGAWDIGAYENGSGGSVTNPVISVSPASLNFGAILAGAQSNKTFTVQNIGNGTLTGAVSVSLPYSVQNGGYSLGAGQTQAVTVVFSPTLSGSFTNTVTFTGGGGASATVSGIGLPSTILPPTVSAITQSGADVDPNTAGLQVYAGSVVQYSGSASDPIGLPLTWRWIYTVNGGAEIVLTNGAGTVGSVSFNYTAGTAGNTYVWKLRVSNGYATGESNLTVGVEAPPIANGITFPATAGNIVAPFVVAGNYISQSVQTMTPPAGGGAYYTFTITNSGNYVIQALVSAPNTGANSFYVSMDAEPQDPTMIWDIPLTSGFEQRIVSWRGTGTESSNQYVPKYFNLNPGVHQLIIRGREANVQLQSFTILQAPSAPQNLHIMQ